eukprot:2310585-Amphidinium_carterae.1
MPGKKGCGGGSAIHNSPQHPPMGPPMHVPQLHLLKNGIAVKGLKVTHGHTIRLNTGRISAGGIPRMGKRLVYHHGEKRVEKVENTPAVSGPWAIWASKSSRVQEATVIHHGPRSK